MNTTLSRSAKPMLNSVIEYAVKNNHTRLETPITSYDFDGQSAEIMKRLIPRLDGTATIEDLSAETKLKIKDVINHLNVLAEENLVLDASQILEAKKNSEFIEAYFRECRFRSQNIFQQPFWQTLMSGAASANLVLGWGLEFYHYVEAANEHMAAAVAQCREGLEIQLWLAEHYAEEFDHSKIFLKGLENCGLNSEQVKNAAPLASTRALINYLTELASRDTLTYTATFGVMQFAQEDTTRSGIEQFCGYLSDEYPFARGFFDAIRKHALIDVDLQHQELVIQRILEKSEDLDPKSRQRIVRAVQDTVEHFILFFEGIQDYYQREDILLPRPALDFRAVI